VKKPAGGLPSGAQLEALRGPFNPKGRLSERLRARDD
jgi:hypothetical protein